MYQKVEPPREKPKDDKGYFEILSKAVFNAGFSYQVVRNKWEGTKEVFHDFELEILSKWTVDEIAEALESPKIIRNSKKVLAIVSNAKVFLNIVEKHGSFEKFLKSFRDKPYDERCKILSKQFKWLGPTGAHFFLWSVGEDAPPCEEIINPS
ncbi:MAG: DNA-3-methyladenine glycosylase I [Promethearchaeota archaeon]|jgi:DNA-3-methyladenine glycosylase I